MCVCVSLLTREHAAHSRDSLYSSGHRFQKAARARRRLSAAEQQQIKPGRDLPTAEALKRNLVYLQPSL